MSRRERVDVVVAGGGVVGATAALALAREGLEVALVEAREPARWRADAPDLRVYALAPDNAALLDGCGIWSEVAGARAHPYRKMRVWDAAGGGELVFDADAFGRQSLGWIVEHGLLVDRLWAALAARGVRILCPAMAGALEQAAQGVQLQLDDGTRMEARVAIAADGADSTLRGLAGIEVDEHDYGQRGIVAYVETTQPHGDTAWQRFLPGGPVALLPFVEGRGSIVWSLPDADADAAMALADDAFGAAVADAFGGRLGTVRPLSRRAAFPLRRRLARQVRSGAVLVLGDAAHVVHPLAGQGVNLGLRDVAGLLAMVRGAFARNADFAAPSRLARWARSRRSENTIAAFAFDGINRVFSNDAAIATLLRGPALGLAGRLPPLAHALWRHAAGIAPRPGR